MFLRYITYDAGWLEGRPATMHAQQCCKSARPRSVCGRHEASRSSAGGDEKMDVNPSVVEGLVREFSSTWKSNIDLINRNVLSYFSNFRNGMEILKQGLTQLLLYYTRFQDIIRKIWRGKPPPFSKDLVSTTLILAEIKKYALAI